MELTISLGFGVSKYMEEEMRCYRYSLNICLSCEVTDFDNFSPMKQKKLLK